MLTRDELARRLACWRWNNGPMTAYSGENRKPSVQDYNEADFILEMIALPEDKAEDGR